MRISGITISDKKRLEFGLTAIYGIGHSCAKVVLHTAHIDDGKRPGELSTAEEQKLRKVIENITTEGELRREISGHIKRLKDIKSYRGIRHTKRLPVRGQRTKTNTRPDFRRAFQIF